MNHTVLKQVILDQRKIIQDSVIIRRNYTFEANANYILTGLRRSGKSTLLYSIVQYLVKNGYTWDQMIYLNFEDERLSDFTWKDFNDIVEVAAEWCVDRKPCYFFDEIQNVDRWESFARRLSDAKERVYITGSNAKMLSREMEERLGGRYMTKEIMTYDLAEYLDARSVAHDENAVLSTRGNGRIRAAANAFMHEGSFPESLQFQNRRSYVENVYQKVLLGDIAARNGIRQVEGLRVLMKKIAETVCTPVSYAKLNNEVTSIGIRLSKDTIISYINYANEAFLIFDIRNYYAKFVERESRPKYYFYDNGLLNLFLVNRDPALLENSVALALKRRYASRFYYLKSPSTGVDIDFFVPEDQMAIQVAYSISSVEARKRETENLVRLARSGSNIEKFLIVTYEEQETIEEGGIEIEVMPLYVFLLRLDSSTSESRELFMNGR